MKINPLNAVMIKIIRLLLNRSPLTQKVRIQMRLRKGRAITIENMLRTDQMPCQPIKICLQTECLKQLLLFPLLAKIGD